MTPKHIKAALFLALLLTPSLLGDSTPVRLVLLVDSSRLKRAATPEKVHAVWRDLIENLPDSAIHRAYRFSVVPTLLPIDPLQMSELDLLMKSPGPEANHASVQQAVTSAELLLCRLATGTRASGARASHKILVVIGESPGGDPILLSGLCKVTVFLISVTPTDDGALHHLANSTGGRYDSLETARGYILAEDIVTRLPAPRLESPNYKPSLRRNYLPLWVGLILLGGGVATICAKLRMRRRRNFPLPSSLSNQATTAPELSRRVWLKTAAGVFHLPQNEPVILGGKPHASTSQPQIFIPDPLLAVHHCRIFSVGHIFFVEDLETESGTVVNGDLITEPRRLTTGDLLKVGNTTLEFTISESLDAGK